MPELRLRQPLTREPRPACDCVARVDADLAERGLNTSVSTTLFTGRVLLRTDKVDPAKRGKPRTIMAAFCPFCGAAYPSASEATTEATEAAHG